MRANAYLKEEAISLRKSGKSYNEIRKILGIKSKGTLSEWFKNLKLDDYSQKILSKNKELARKRGLLNANRKRKEKIKQENIEAFDDGKNNMNLLPERDLMLIGSILYWGEGVKSERSKPTLTLCNSDPLIISIYLRFVREVLKIPEEKIRAGIHLYPSIPVEDARKFWSEVTKLPEDRFYIVTQVSRASQNKRPFNILPYGTLAVKVNNRHEFYKVKGMIKGVAEAFVG